MGRPGERTGPALAPLAALAACGTTYEVPEAFCRSQTARIPSFACDVRIGVDAEATHRDAFQSHGPGSAPQATFTLPLLADARNSDGLAFVMGHKAGHHVGRHIRKGLQQIVAGALILDAPEGLRPGRHDQRQPLSEHLWRPPADGRQNGARRSRREPGLEPDLRA